MAGGHPPDFVSPPKFLPNLDYQGNAIDDVTAQVVWNGSDPSAISCQIHNDSDYMLLIDDSQDDPGYGNSDTFYVDHRIILPHTTSIPFGVNLYQEPFAAYGTKVYFRLAVWNAPGSEEDPKRFVNNHIKEQDERYVCVGDGMRVMSYLYVMLAMVLAAPYQINMVESHEDDLSDNLSAALSNTHHREADTEYEMTAKIKLEGTVKVLSYNIEEGITGPNAFITVSSK